MNIGDEYGGGKIFYISPEKTMVLIVAPVDVGDESNCYWGVENIRVGANDEGIGDGKYNTDLIITSQVNTAAEACRAYNGGGFNDWYLPSKTELFLLYSNKTLYGMGDDFYWSSTEHDITNAWSLSCNAVELIGAMQLRGKWNGMGRRPIRQVIFPPIPPTLLSPEDNAINVPITSLATWSAGESVTGYIIQKALDVNFTLGVTTKQMGNFTSNQFNDPILEHDTSYWLRVKAINAVGESDWSVTRSFTTIQVIPNIPLLNTPEDGAVNVSTHTLLSWFAAKRADTYDIEISINSDFSKKIFWQNCVAIQRYFILKNNTTYYWRVLGVNIAGIGRWSIARSFTTIQAIPDIPLLNIPKDGVVKVSLRPILTWNAVSGASSYRLQMSLVENFATQVINVAGIPPITYFFVRGPLANNTVYYWRICSVNAVGESDWSVTRSFTTKQACPGIPSLVFPENGAVNVPLRPTLTWNAASGASSYGLQMWDEANLRFYTPKLIGTSYLVTTDLSSNTVYHWEMHSINDDGNGSGYSEIRSFTTISLPLVASFISDEELGGVVVGRSSLKVHFHSTSTGSPKLYKWMVDGVVFSRVPDPIKFFTVEGQYTICLNVQRGIESETVEKVAYITVTHGVATSIVLTTEGGITSLESGSQIPLIVKAKDAANNEWDATEQVVLTENDPIGTIAGNVYTARAVGTWLITATI